MKRTGDWMQTYSGRRFWPLDPRPEEVFIEDIAHSLSMQCRYAGHCLHFYSVAEHSVLLAWAMGNVDDARWALLHDASEAYLVDIPRPLKRSLVGYGPAEVRAMLAICARFRLPPGVPARVKQFDDRIIADERSNLGVCEHPWDFDAQPLGVELMLWSPAAAEAAFLTAFKELFPEFQR